MISENQNQKGLLMGKAVDKIEREKLIQVLTNMLPVLRAAIGISQGEISEYIGVSRQTYCALEVGKRQMSWNTFLALFFFFYTNKETHNLLKMKKGFIARVNQVLQYQTAFKL